MVERATNTCIWFLNIAAKQVEKRYARFTANRVQILNVFLSYLQQTP